jgi:hypothetical protein
MFRERPEPARVKHVSGVKHQGRLLAFNTNIKRALKNLEETRHSSLLQKLINYDRKKFYGIDPTGKTKTRLLTRKIVVCHKKYTVPSIKKEI